MFTPTFLTEIRGGYSRNATGFQSRFHGRDIAAELGLPTVAKGPEFQGFPRIRISDHFRLGDR